MSALATQGNKKPTTKGFHEAQKRLETLKNRIEKVKASTEKVVEKVVRTAEVGGTAFAMGVITGKLGHDPEAFGVPLTLGAGIALNVLGYMGAAGKMSDHVGNIGDGCLAAFGVFEGVQVGAAWAAKSAAPAQIPASTKGVGLTPEEIAHAAAMAGR